MSFLNVPSYHPYKALQRPFPLESIRVVGRHATVPALVRFRPRENRERTVSLVKKEKRGGRERERKKKREREKRGEDRTESREEAGERGTWN